MWEIEKYNAVEDLKRTKANMSMFDMKQNFLNQREAVLKTLDHEKEMPNANTIPQKIILQKINTF